MADFKVVIIERPAPLPGQKKILAELITEIGGPLLARAECPIASGQGDTRNDALANLYGNLVCLYAKMRDIVLSEVLVLDPIKEPARAR
jgi:hypothetical protein